MTWTTLIHVSYIYWDGTGKTLVARGKVFEAATVLHDMELSEDEVKVTVKEVLVPFALVLVQQICIFYGISIPMFLRLA